MKKFLLILMCVCMILSIVGCGNSDKKVNTPEPQKTEQASPTNSTSQTTEPTAEPTDEPEYDNVAYVAGKKIYVNYKNGRRKDEKHTSLVFHSNYTEMVSLVYNKRDSFNGDLDDVFDFLNDGLLFGDLAVYSDASFFDSSKSYPIVPKSQEAVLIGDLNTIRIVGSVEDTYGRNCYVYGYTFIIDELPCFLVGFVFSEAQEQALIDSITDEVDQMIKTVRTER